MSRGPIGLVCAGLLIAACGTTSASAPRRTVPDWADVMSGAPAWQNVTSVSLGVGVPF